jgi:predicted CoA-binding protein
MEPSLRDILTSSPTIVVLGIHDDPARPASYVPTYLHEHGYRILGVNPALAAAGKSLYGEPVRASLAEVPGPYDLVDVFRRAELLPEHEEELATSPARVIWFQLGIVNDAVAERLRARGKIVVQDRCTLAEHRRLGLAAL